MIDQDEWQTLPGGVRKNLYVNGAIDEFAVNVMNRKGYDIVDVRTMPNSNAFEKKDFIQAYLLGISEGTITSSDEKRKSLELLAKTEGLLVNKSITGKLNLTFEGKTLEELLNFGDSRHTLRPASQEELDQAKTVSIAPGGTDDKVHKDP